MKTFTVKTKTKCLSLGRFSCHKFHLHFHTVHWLQNTLLLTGYNTLLIIQWTIALTTTAHSEKSSQVKPGQGWISESLSPLLEQESQFPPKI